MALGRPMHFEIHAEDPERAVKFYRDAFDWKINKWDGPTEYWLVTTGAEGTSGINGGIVRRMGPSPQPGQPCNAYPCTIPVKDLDATLAKLKSLGAKQVVDPMLLPKVGRLAYCTDTEGNIFGVLQPALETAD